MISPDEIAADRAVIDAATGGEWSAYGYEVRADFPDGDGCRVAGYVEELDAAFIAAARTGWPRALDALEVMADAVLDEMARAEKAEAAIARVRALCDDFESNVEPYEQGTYYVAESRILAAIDGGESA